MGRKMKNSGIEWIGEIPEGWEVIPCKFCFKICNGSDPLTTEGTIPVYGSGSKSFKTCKEYKEGPTVLLGRKGTINIPQWVNEKYWNVDTAFDAKPKGNYNLKLFFYVAICFDYERYSTQTALPSMTQIDYNNSKIPYMKVEEQQQIASFLDEKCSKIDSLVADIKKQIEILEQYRKSVITEAVTKGLDPNVKMKDSGIEWIGEIPEGWEVKKIKYVIQNNSNGIKVGPFGSSLTNLVVGCEDGEYKIYGQANLIRRNFDYGDNFVTGKTYKQLKNYEVLSNDICISMMGTIGKCCVVPQNIKKGIMDSHLIKIRLSDNEHPNFFEYCYESNMGFEQLLYNSKGSIINGLNSSIIKNIYIPFPSFFEQQQIALYLDLKCSKIDELIKLKNQQLETLTQYKKSLIYEYVTGKKEVV